MAEPQQARRYSPPGRQKNQVRISYICQERIDANLIEASRGMSNESVGYKELVIFSPVFSLIRLIRKIFVWELLGPHARAWGSLGLLLNEHSKYLSAGSQL